MNSGSRKSTLETTRLTHLRHCGVKTLRASFVPPVQKIEASTALGATPLVPAEDSRRAGQVQRLNMTDLEAGGGDSRHDRARQMTTAGQSLPNGFNPSLPAIDSRIRCKTMLTEQELATRLQHATGFRQGDLWRPDPSRA